MSTNVVRPEWKPKESAGKHWTAGAAPAPIPFPEQRRDTDAAPLLAVDVEQLERMSFSGVLQDAAVRDGRDHDEIAEAIHVSPGYFSKFLRAVAEAWARRLVAYCRETKTVAPIQWLAHQVGGELVMRDSRAARIAELQAQLQELQRDQRRAA